MSSIPNVSMQVAADNILTTSGESESPDFLAGVIIPGSSDLIKAVGTTAEVSNSFLVVKSLTDWYSRLNSTQGNGAGFTFDGFGSPTPSGAVGERRWPSGATGTWKTEWWTTESYLRYGGSAVVGISASVPFTSSAEYNLNAAFGVSSGISGDLTDALDNRDNDFLAIYTIQDVNSGVPAPSPNGNKVFVFGSKLILPPGVDIGTISSDSDYVEIPLSADVAGCLARTARDSNLFSAPAGMKRGIIIDGDNLKTPLTATQATNLYNNRINPILGFPESGPVLFGNKTGATAGAADDRIETSSLLIYLKREIGAFARQILFERNTTTTRQIFINQAQSVLEEVRSEDAISEFNIICDETNNPEDTVNAGVFVADIFIKPYKAINFIKLTFTNTAQTTQII